METYTLKESSTNSDCPDVLVWRNLDIYSGRSTVAQESKQHFDPGEELEGFDPKHRCAGIHLTARRPWEKRLETQYRGAREHPIDYKCEACGWCQDNRFRTDCQSNNKIIYWMREHAVWKIGNSFVFKEKQDIDIPLNPGLGLDATTTSYISENSDVPIRGPWIGLFDEKRLREYNILACVEGETLFSARYCRMPSEQYPKIIRQLYEAMWELRKLQSAKPELHTVEGDPAGNGYYVGSETCFSPRTRQAFIDYLATERRPNPRCADQELKEFRERLPAYEPLIMTHGDLDDSNLLVRDGELVTIIDWERAGFSSVWWDYVTYHDFGRSPGTLPRLTIHDYIGQYPEVLKRFQDLRYYYPSEAG